MASAFSIQPLSPLEEIARIVSNSIRTNTPLNMDVVDHWKAQMTSKEELLTADIIIKGLYRSSFWATAIHI